ncbi:MAG: periplasmic heavy metal sensor, partial [Rhodomicrobium sp.]|nr:periplasmic heavy metal sensor [Rhodomicrobium sp.]
LSRVEASPEQKAKVGTVIKTAVNDLAALGVKPWEMRAQFIELMRADTVDAAALEALRAEQLGKIDAASKRIVQAMTEAAEALTPEQRRELTDRWQKRFSR